MSFEDRENRLLEMKMMLQSLHTWRVAWNSLHVSNISKFLELCSFSIIEEFLYCILPVYWGCTPLHFARIYITYKKN
jgi:hypothetical protein